MVAKVNHPSGVPIRPTGRGAATPERSRPRAIPLVGLLAFLLAGCASLGHAHLRDNPFERDAQGVVFLEVRNTLEEDVHLRARTRSGVRDLGVVSPRSVTRLTFPWGEFDRLSLQLEPATGSRFTLPPLEVRSGEVLELVIQSPIDRSSLRR